MKKKRRNKRKKKNESHIHRSSTMSQYLSVNESDTGKIIMTETNKVTGLKDQIAYGTQESSDAYFHKCLLIPYLLGYQEQNGKLSNLL